MAMDGSFKLESSVNRFLARCPKLSRRPRFETIAKMGELVTEDEVVALLGDVFVHPDYTIPLIGCFRPLARKIVKKVVSLLRLVPNLRSNSEGSLEEVDKKKILENIDCSDSNLIESFVRNGRGLNLHELACLAFCRALDLVPFLMRSVLDYFKFAPAPFERIMKKDTEIGLPIKGEDDLLRALRISYRMLLLSPEMVSKLWDWSCFLDLARKFMDVSNCTELEYGAADIRWCTAQIIRVIFKLTDTDSMNLGIQPKEAFECLMRWQEFCCDVCLEKAGSYIGSPEGITSERVVHLSQSNFLESSPVHSGALSQFSSNERSSLPQRLATWNEKSVTTPFVLTSAVSRSFEMVVLAASQKWPVLLYGPPGVGKSALIRKLAQDSGENVLSIHMDDQIDGKTLAGSYVCAEQPGEFKWQPGSLTQAVMKGYWVVFEDIDKAPADVHSLILPLLEGATSFLTGHGEEIRVADSFRLFSTVSNSRLHAGGSNGPGNLWRRVKIGQSSHKDLEDIVTTWFPNLESLASKLIETFERINFVTGQYLIGDNAVSSSSGRFSLRDLLKWCKRIVGLGFDLMEGSLSTYVCRCIYEEAVDIFAAFSTTADSRLAIRKETAKIWAVPIEEAETSYPVHKPVIQDLPSEVKIGRISLPRARALLHDQKKPFVEICRSLHAIERIACSIKYNEPVLLVGETGTGKTTLVQDLALRLGQRLTVLNLSQQSDIADLLGGFKPMNAQYICIPLYREFEDLFSKTFSVKVNADFLVCLRKHVSGKNWKVLLNGMSKGVKFFHKTMEAGVCKPGEKRKKTLNEETIEAWETFSLKLKAARRQIGSAGMLFSFVEGAFINALRNGEWILLDEVNLASPEILQRVTAVLEGDQGSLCLAERGDAGYIKRHPNFRIFACMNPATDAGKRELPFSVRSRFTEYFIDDVLDDDDLALFISHFVDDSPAKAELVKKIMHFYKAARKDSEECLQDGANQKPQYSLRSLYRALEFTRKARQFFMFEKALYDGFCLFFLNLLDRPSAEIMNRKIVAYLLGDIQGKRRVPPSLPFNSYITVEANSDKDDFVENYVLTKSVLQQLQNIARAVFIKKYPVLLQGPTSSGKTSLVRYLATVTGHEFVRINNHEHTDLQEYLGSYITDASGKLVFNEGALVRAVRIGSWIVLDELNLAPSDVLEALNRLLDDNREIFVPELQETIRAHPDFMLFATQNPPIVYGGRKILSRAFRNRFIEIHVDEIPEEELSTILENRCKISGTYAKKMVEVMKDLQLHRQNSNIFAGKHGFITPRDLFRWANRVRKVNSDGLSSAKKHHYEDLAKEGYYLLAERLRDEGEKNVVKEVLLRHFHVPLDEDIYWQESSDIKSDIDFVNTGDSENFRNIVWTRSMWRLYFLIKCCYEMREPVLLVGETGGGKTTVCQMLSIVLKSKLHILNCHQYTETSDFIGGFYPVRERSRLVSQFKALVEDLMLAKAFVNYPGSLLISNDIGQASSTLDQLSKIIDGYRKGLVSSHEVSMHELDFFEQRKRDLELVQQRWQSIFTWQDGPLVQAMKAGHLFLVDEISLADDSVLERLNSVLEPERTLSLPEKGGPALEKVVAHENFFILATMNPGGDYGKKELSPALRNRFTEIWVPPIADVNELRSIAMERVSKRELSYVVDPIAKFWEWFNKLETGRSLTLRDILSWVTFINTTERVLGAEYSLFHGLFLTLLDGLSLGTGMLKTEAEELKEKCLKFLEHLVVGNNSLDSSHLSRVENYVCVDPKNVIADVPGHGNLFGIDPFYIEKGNEKCEAGGFELLAPTTCRNALRVLRAMQLRKPVLLEGSPGVGKTSLVVALGKFSGHKVVRINLSEQTDMMDLLGSDLPVDSDEGIAFAWSDGILLQALKEGCWVLLDELNLAPQSVLEGLNSILDHRAEVFIPELGQTYICPPSFRVFACQNPSSQGGGRKGLPKSFLNRFSKVYVDELIEDDYVAICSALYPSIPKPLLSKLIIFNKEIFEETMLLRKFAQDGSPWEFNVRDVMRSCQIITDAPESLKVDCFLNLLYVQRMRTAADRRQVLQLYQQVFEKKPCINPFPRVQLTSQYLIVGSTSIRRNNTATSSVSNSELKILPGIRQNLEAVASCVKYQWLCILIGPSSSGKTSLIRILSHLTCNVLHELNLSSTTDISELLGCFEQYSVFRHLRLVVTQIDCYVSEYCRLHLKHSVREFIDEKKDLFLSKWNSFLASFDLDDLSGTSLMLMNNWGRVASSFNLLIEIIVELKLVIERNVIPVSWSREEVDKIMSRILKLQELQERTPNSAKFEWVTGLLIKAIEKGEWIVLEDANLCNPTVLDRINSLVETCGSITVNECGTIDGKPVVLHPHPNFRMFLTVNPCYGEVSRAMRNRGVEIYMMQPFWQFEGKGYEIAEMKLDDVKRFLIQSGIPGGSLVNSMAKAHMHAHDEGLRLNVFISYLELTRWVQLFQQLATSGNSLLWSLRVSWEHTYLPSFGDMEGEVVIAHVIDSYLFESAFSKSVSLISPLCLPGGWPIPLKSQDFNLYPRAASVKQNCMYLEFLGARCALCEVQGKENELIQRILLAQSAEPLVEARFLVDKFRTGIHDMAYWMDMKMLQSILFPKDTMLHHLGETPTDLALASKMLLFAADWSIEQATFSDLDLYIVWFRWFSSHLAPFCEIFSSFLASLKEELSHPIWKYIKSVLLKHFDQIHVDLQTRPMLSSELINLVAYNEDDKKCVTFLHNAVNCVGLLRHSNRQWNSEESGLRGDYHNLQPLLNSIRVLEEQVLELLVESANFNHLFKLYDQLLQDHIEFWDSVTSSQFDRLLVFWRALVKDIKKLLPFCPHAASTLTILEGSKNVVGISSWHLSSEKSLLWLNGGRPPLPPAAGIYYKQLDFFKLCDSIWPPVADLWRNCDEQRVELIAMLNTELRDLAVQGICIASLSGLLVGDHGIILQRLEEMHWMLKERFEYEKRKVKNLLSCKEDMVVETDAPSLSQILCTGSDFASWLEILYLNDCTSFFLDTDLLKNAASSILLDPDKFQEAFSSMSHLVKFNLEYSLLNSMLRPPQMFSAHQKLLWFLDAWTSLDQENGKIAAFVLEMWFRWHSSLWDLCPKSLLKALKPESFDTSLPDIMFQSVRTMLTLQIQQSSCNIKDFSAHCLKLKVASSNIWQASAPNTSLSDFLLSAARALLQQIIYAHRQSFDADVFIDVKFTFSSLHENTDTPASIAILRLRSLIFSSSHEGLRNSLQIFIEPALKELYLHCLPNGSSYNLGLAWLHIGSLRCYLLHSSDDLDPALKYSCKKLQLERRCSLLELEIKVREECDYLAGWFSAREPDKRRELIETLKSECSKIERKVVFRADPKKFKKLKGEINDIAQQASLLMFSVVNKNANFPQVACDWQKTATSFIERLAVEYSEYVDIIQPIQVALFEMKLGLSLVLSSILEKGISNALVEKDMERVMEVIYSFMRFPRSRLRKLVDVSCSCISQEVSTYDVKMPASFSSSDVKLLEELAQRSAHSEDKLVSESQLKLAFHHNILIQTAHSVGNAQAMSQESFALLDETFSAFAELWLDMKIQSRKREDFASQQFRFKPRGFEMANVVEVDISTLGGLSASESFLEWQKLEAGEESTERIKTAAVSDSSEGFWDIMQDPVVVSIVHIHNQLFGSSNFILPPKTFQESDVNKLQSFMDSYRLGAEMIKGFWSLYSASLDSRLMPEHLLHLCLNHQQISSHMSAPRYNFYKHSNASVMSQMVKFLVSLERRVLSLLSEWEGHPDLQKILDVIRMLLAIPFDTPLAKVLSGLQFLINKVCEIQESGSKFSLSDQLEPIVGLAASWHKLESESWLALLDEVQHQYETNAAKLWFSLCVVLNRPFATAGNSEHEQSTIQSLEELIQMSNIGEFRKRLQLLLAFAGQISCGLRFGDYSSYHTENLKILCNSFGFYLQFLPIILEHIESNRKNIEKEIRELTKLCKWQHVESHLSMENTRRFRQKCRKLIQKYSDVLEQPVKAVLSQKSVQNGLDSQYLLSPKFLCLLATGNDKMMLELTESYNRDRFVWYANWRKKASEVAEILQSSAESAKLPCLEVSEDVKSTIKRCSVAQFLCPWYQGEWEELWSALGNICANIVGCGELWEKVDGVGKKTALSNLLKLLESHGLSKHMSALMEDRNESSWLRQPAPNMWHLLPMPAGDACVSSACKSNCSLYDTMDGEWKTANECFYKSLVSMQLLQHICLMFHKDFTLEQVTRSGSFLFHLLVVQQEQRDALYDLSANLKHLHKCASSLGNLYRSSECIIAENQHMTLQCLWQQKQLFDSLLAILREGSLLLKQVENKACNSVLDGADGIFNLDSLIPEIQQAKEVLDDYLLDHDDYITVFNNSLHGCIISSEMQEKAYQNFRVLKNFKEDVAALRSKNVGRILVRDTLLDNLDDILNKGAIVSEQFESSFQKPGEATTCSSSDVEADFYAAFKVAVGHALHTVQKLASLECRSLPDQPCRSITSWKMLLNSCVVDLKLKELSDNTLKTICLAEKLVNHAGTKDPGLRVQLGASFREYHSMLVLILDFGNGLLKDLLSFHKMISIMTHMLAKNLSLLFSKGFGTAVEEQLDDCGNGTSQTANGTGLGAGAGIKDVSDQIENEDQLLGYDDKLEREQDAASELPSKNEKGIEMEQDFAADMLSVSEDSGEDDNDNEESDAQQIESEMGEAGGDGEVIDEKLWNKHDSQDGENTNEKYESGPSVKDNDDGDREFWAKEEDVQKPKEPETIFDGSDVLNDANRNEDDVGDQDNEEGISMDKEEAYTDPSGLEPSQPNRLSEEDTEMMNEGVDTGAMEEDGGMSDNDGSADGNQEDGIQNTDENMEEAELKEVPENPADDVGASEVNVEMDLTTEKDLTKQGGSSSRSDCVPSPESETKLKGDSGHSSSVNNIPEANWSASGNAKNDLAPLSGQPSSTQPSAEFMVLDSSYEGKLADHGPKPQLPPPGASPFQKAQPNPYRSVGDALDGWKERIKLSIDLPEDKGDEKTEIDDENADEYGYVTQHEKGTAQASGPATSEQMDHHFNSENFEIATPSGVNREEFTEMETDLPNQEAHRVSSSTAISRDGLQEPKAVKNLEKSADDGAPRSQDLPENSQGKQLESLVHVKRSFPRSETLQLSRLSIGTDERDDAQEHQDISGDAKDNVTSLWRKYELCTSRLSQELAEQLRLVLEPTLASKLQGDYKTGKRINMKKVIPYIASQYLKDKIWLRRTRPDKRDYQVVIAVDDSRSMSESGCGNVAVEALVTVSRALSQLEMGNLAIASFGKMGNLRLLHDFDRPFTREAGIKMISGLTFKQENTIADEPVVDLLKHLKKMLDVSVSKARLPSGHNPLQQLVLIIADGRFHEKELKRCVRDFLNSKRVVAFLLLDSPEESIMDLMEASFQGENIKFSKYLDSFPFPYYIVLKNIEALPRTLSDLLRQWFELMQHSRD